MNFSLPSELVTQEVFGVLLVFARLGSALMVLPGFAEAYVNARARLWIGLATSVLLAAVLKSSVPMLPADPAALARVVLTEVVIGLFIGSTLRMVVAGLHVAGSIIALQSGLSAAMYFDPSESSQSTLPGHLLVTTLIVLMFVTGADHWLLHQLAASFGRLPPGASLPLGDMVELVTRLGGEAIALGLAVAAPLLALSFITNLALGVLARVVPSLQVLFVALPIQLGLSLAVLALTLAAGLTAALRFLEHASAWLAGG